MPFKRQKSTYPRIYHDTRTVPGCHVEFGSIRSRFARIQGRVWVVHGCTVCGQRGQQGRQSAVENCPCPGTQQRWCRSSTLQPTWCAAAKRASSQRILYYAYLSPQQCENATGAILQSLESKGISISLRTYYVHRDEAIEVLSSILWGYTSQDCEKITNLLTPDWPCTTSAINPHSQSLFLHSQFVIMVIASTFGDFLKCFCTQEVSMTKKNVYSCSHKRVKATLCAMCGVLTDASFRNKRE